MSCIDRNFGPGTGRPGSHIDRIVNRGALTGKMTISNPVELVTTADTVISRDLVTTLSCVIILSLARK